MLFRKKIEKISLILLAALVCALSNLPLTAAAQTKYLYLGGFPAGFSLSTTTVEIVGLCDITASGGICSPARDAGLKAGDVIDKINGEEINKTSDINAVLAREYKKFELTYIRGGEYKTVEITPATDIASGKKRLGALVKDSINGVGTMTYIDGESRKFASLGHPVSDSDGNVTEINGGTVFGCIIYDVKAGVRGTPGELKGAFESNNIIGKADLNCPCGIYGELSADYDLSGLRKVECGSVENAKIGKACIYSTTYGSAVEEYEISIVKVDKTNRENRNFVIKIEDDKLINKTGGIVQGMSGSPIVQNGRLIGAVTHVFVNDPTRGYGIAIDKMISSY